MNFRWLHHSMLALLLGLGCGSVASVPVDAAEPYSVPVRVVTELKGDVLEVTLTWAQSPGPVLRYDYTNGSLRIIAAQASLKGDTQVLPLNGSNAKEAFVSQIDADRVFVNIRAEQKPNLKVFNLPTVKNVQGIKYVIPINLPSNVKEVADSKEVTKTTTVPTSQAKPVQSGQVSKDNKATPAPSESAQKSSSPAQPAATKPADAKPAQLAAATKSADAKPAQPTTATKPADAKPAQPATATKPADAKPAQPTAATKPADAKPAQPAATTKPADAKPAQPAAATKPADQKKPAQPAAATKPADAKPAQPAAATKPADAKSAQPAAATKPADQKKPVAEVKPSSEKEATAENKKALPIPPQLTPKDEPAKVKVIFNPKAEELRVGLVYKGNLKNVVRKAEGKNSRLSIELCPAVMQGPTQAIQISKGQILGCQAKQVNPNTVLVEVMVQNPPYFTQEVNPQGGALYGISYNYPSDYHPRTSEVKSTSKTSNPPITGGDKKTPTTQGPSGKMDSSSSSSKPNAAAQPGNEPISAKPASSQAPAATQISSTSQPVVGQTAPDTSVPDKPATKQASPATSTVQPTTPTTATNQVAVAPSSRTNNSKIFVLGDPPGDLQPSTPSTVSGGQYVLAYFPIKNRNASTIVDSLIKLYPDVIFKVDTMLNIIFVKGKAEDVNKVSNILKQVSQ